MPAILHVLTLLVFPALPLRSMVRLLSSLAKKERSDGTERAHECRFHHRDYPGLLSLLPVIGIAVGVLGAYRYRLLLVAFIVLAAGNLLKGG
jgi:hypothetical protein